MDEPLPSQTTARSNYPPPPFPTNSLLPQISPCGNFEKRTRRSLDQIMERVRTSGTQFPIHDPVTNEIVCEAMPRHIGEWIPEGWTTCAGRTSLRRAPPLRELHQFLVRASETGAISRQELVSMIPALILDVQPGNWVMDMCAAPGSKSLQILEALERHGRGGVLVANDVDTKRAYMLTHRAKTLKSACLVVTTHDASQMPQLSGKDGLQIYDRVLCDVPCSGDGTVRKNPGIWSTLKVRDGCGLNAVQVRIATRGFNALKLGGRMVYSTCSFNPIENEAVVVELLRSFEGCIRLMDTKDLLPGLIRRPGITKPWRVPLRLNENEPIQFFETYEEFTAWNQALERPLGDVLKEVMFPPKGVDLSTLKLDRCMRLLPQDQDTGGFFVALFEKIAEPTKRFAAVHAAMGEVEAGGATSSSSASPPPPFTDAPKSRRPYRFNKNDVWYEDIDDATWESIKSEWGIREDGQTVLVKKLLQVRCENRGKCEKDLADVTFPGRVSWVNADVLELFDISSERGGALHIVHAGISAFHKATKGKLYRVVNDFASVLLPHVTRRVAEISFSHLKTMYEGLKTAGVVPEEVAADKVVADAAASVSAAAGVTTTTLNEDVEEPANGEDEVVKEENDEHVDAAAAGKSDRPSQAVPKSNVQFSPSISFESLDPAQVEELKKLTEGGMILKLNPQDQARYDEEIGGTFALSAWWGRAIRVMVDKQELLELMSQLKGAGLI